MIPRYTREKMGSLFTDQSRLDTWLEVELAASEVLAERGDIPISAYRKMKRKARVDVDRALEIEKTVNHDVIAFVSAVVETIGPEGRYLHLGLTSSDVVDTSLALQMVRAFDQLIEAVDEYCRVLASQAQKYADVPIIGRTHGVNAEPTTLGLKIASWYTESMRGRERLVHAREQVRFGKLSGAVGTCAHISPTIEKAVMKKLGLNVEPVATQVIPRDRHAEALNAIALVGAHLERVATEIRHLQRTEVREVEEPFRKGQKGSSAMPHKRNPIACENTTGLARLLRSNANAAMQNIALWHERDISHSSVERVIIPDSFILLDFMLGRMTRVVRDMHVYPERMQQNIGNARGFLFSQTLLLALVETGLTREQSYHLVQRNAMDVWADKHPTLRDACLADEEVVEALGKKGVERAFDMKRLLRNVPKILRRVADPPKKMRARKTARAKR